MSAYKSNELIAGVRLFNSKNRVVNPVAHTTDVSRFDASNMQVLVCFVILFGPDEETQVIVANVLDQNEIYELGSDPASGIFKPLQGNSLLEFTDSREFFRNLRLREQEFISAGKQAEYANVWVDYYRKLKLTTLSGKRGDRLNIRMVDNDLKVPFS